MASLSKDRDTPKRSGDTLVLGVAEGKKIFAGALVARNAGGYATPGATSTALLGVGRAEEYVDNSGGLDGDKAINISKGVFLFRNAPEDDEITRADIGNDCYIVDDQTVAKTDGEGTRSIAGRIFDIELAGVWVKFG